MGIALAILVAGIPPLAHAQSYEDVEARVRRQLEDEKARMIGDCSEAMVSWLGLRFTQVDRENGKAHAACAAAQRFALRNNVPFNDALPKIALAMGGTRREACSPPAEEDTLYQLYSGCYIPRPTPTPTAPVVSAWDVDRAREAKELGPALLAHLKPCVSRVTEPFAFNVDAEGRMQSFNDVGNWGRFSPPPTAAAELKRIEKSISGNSRCSVFPEELRRRYVLIRPDKGVMKVEQVRPDDARRP